MNGWLTGWKRIADYMDIHVDTARDYRRRFGLPIRYGPGGNVFAIPEELNAWLIIFHQKYTMKPGRPINVVKK